MKITLLLTVLVSSKYYNKTYYSFFFFFFLYLFQLLFLVFFICYFLSTVSFREVYPIIDNVENNGSIDEACNCDHCFKTNEEAEIGGGEIPSSVVHLLKEDADGDGRQIICARARDLPDHSFPSVCHMLCHNRCTRFNVVEVTEGSVKSRHVTAYRTSKLMKIKEGIAVTYR